jgi:hypothetical protein
MVSGRRGDGEADRFGLDETTTYVDGLLERLVPRPLARRAVSVALETDRDVYDRGDPVVLDVRFRNRLPIPLSVPTPSDRLWGWRVDGRLEASDETPYLEPSPNAFRFRALEEKQFTRTWNGRLQTGRRFELPSAGEHTLEAFLAVAGRENPVAEKTVEFR